jgi:hypothetical protein
MRKYIAGYLVVMAALFGLTFLLGNTQPALAQAAPARVGQEAVTPIAPADVPPPDLSWLSDYAAEAQQLLAPALAGAPIALLVLIWTSGASFVGLAVTQIQKQRWAIGTGLAFGLLASMSSLPDTTTLSTMTMITLIAGAVVRGLTAGILAALLYESGRGLLNRGKTP